MGEIKRITITGASGTGKTTLAKHISFKYDIPFITSSAREVWPLYGFKNHRDALEKCLAEPFLGFRYQKAIWERRHKMFDKQFFFVTDRSPVDNFAYFMLQQGYYSKENNDEMFSRCLMDYESIDVIIFVRFVDDMEIEDNGRRITDIRYQRMVDAVIETVLRKDFAKFNTTKDIIELKTWDFNERIEIIDSLGL